MNPIQSKIVVFALVVAIAGALAQMRLFPQALGQPAPKGGQTKPVSGPVVEGFILTVQPLKKSYTAGEPILVTTNLKNVSKNTVQLGGIYLAVNNKLQVSLRGVKSIPLTLFGQQLYKGKSAQNFTIYLKPGKSIRYTYVLNRLYDMSLDGTYRVSVSAQVPRLGNNGPLVAIKSNQVTIEVQETPVLVDEEDLPKVAPPVDKVE